MFLTVCMKSFLYFCADYGRDFLLSPQNLVINSRTSLKYFLNKGFFFNCYSVLYRWVLGILGPSRFSLASHCYYCGLIDNIRFVQKIIQGVFILVGGNLKAGGR